MFAFELTNDKGDKESWYLDLKESGKVGKGQPPKKADGASDSYLGLRIGVY